MTAHAIDTLEAANSLKDAGADEKLAEAIVKVYDGAARMDKETFATKADLANAKLQIILSLGGLMAFFKALDYFLPM